MTILARNCLRCFQPERLVNEAWWCPRCEADYYPPCDEEDDGPDERQEWRDYDADC